MDVLSLRALLTLDSTQYEEGLSNAESEAKGFGSKFKSAMATTAKAGAAAIGAAAGAVALLGKSSISAYADTEQLVGGVKKLYGNMGMAVEDYAKSVGKSVSEVNAEWKRNEQAQKLVLDNAKEAFRTTGLSSNEYMEQATSFSAALINSLGGDTVKAAEQTDVAMRAISDNYNTFGGDMQNIQYAFQGFAKQNYTMLDNLKLGYGGTKTEMQRLIDDANTWAEENGKAADLSIDSFSDVVTAIEYIQEKQGIAGTTAREASTTIAGSIGMVKAAWENLVSGLADPEADISKLVTDLTSAVTTAGKNIMPAISQFAQGFGQALTELAPTIIEGIPALLSDIVPMLIESATQLVGVMVQTITTALPQMLDVGKQLLQSLVDGIGENAEGFISSGMDLILQFSEFMRNSASELVPIALTLIQSLAQGIINNIPTFIATVPQIISNFANIINDNAPSIIATGVSILQSLVTGLISAIPVLIANIPQIIKAFVAVVKAFGWVSLGKTIIKGLASGIRAAGSLIKSAVTKPITAARAAIIAGFSAAKQKAVDYMTKLKDGVKQKINAAKDAVKKVVDKIKSFFPVSVGKIFSGWIPKIKLFTKKSGDSASTSSSVSHTKFAKAMSQPYLFTKPTIFNQDIAGEAGDEVLYGRTALMSDIKKAVGTGKIDAERLGAIIGGVVGEIVGERIADELEGMTVVLDKRQFGKMARKAVGV